ncbi:MAG TPA: BTAD domain-containing putative transcriptional regulator [Pseudonocardiaceae bacterium]|jgi:DNA-binding SARP family transcriptional activator/Tfp pilus assembly protein PilF|nr:BTAD domain-containing putative transcriptional regulator [Pseudonocardiaceae bacterium]
MAVQFRILGSVEASIDDQLVDLGPRQQQCVLVALLVNANRPVSGDELIERAWGESPPPRARNTLYTYLSRLRQALSGTEDVQLLRRPAGYQLEVDEQAVDLHLFRTLTVLARANPDPEAASRLIRRALDLWRGEALPGLDTPWLHGIRATLLKDRLAAELEYTDLALTRGRHAELLATLAGQTEQRPLDERLAGQFMLALYRSGRQADALTHYQRTQARLGDELGIRPSEPLRTLHQQMLTADPTLAAPRPAGAAETDAARSVAAHLAELPPPRQLPAAPRTFAGRVAEIALLSRTVDAHPANNGGTGGTVVISAIGGAGGMGKTSLALHWAHQHAHRFPDGQLFVNLRGFDPSGQPRTAESAVRILLAALGVEAGAVPVDLDAQVGLYRSLVADKRMLIVLDNAADAEQVSPLLPGSASCTVLVTSRDRLTSLVNTHGAQPLPLDVLDDADARSLLAQRLGAERVAAEPAAVAELLACCAGLPLALSIVIGRAQEHPEFPLATLAAELRERTNRLGALDEDADSGVRAVLSWSHVALSPAQAGVFALLGLAVGPDISLPAAASLTGLRPNQLRTVLRQLERVSLLQQPLPGRYRMHDLIRLYAGEQAEQLSEKDRSEALGRLVNFYTYTALAGDRLTTPNRERIDIGEPSPGAAPEPLVNTTSATNWFDTEYWGLRGAQTVAMEQGWHQPAWLITWTLTNFHRRRGHPRDDLAVCLIGLSAAGKLGDGRALALAHRMLGYSYARAGRHPEAARQFAIALAEHDREQDRVGKANTHYNFALALERAGDDRQALAHAEQALEIFRSLGSPIDEGRALNEVAWFEARLGEYDRARTACEAALRLNVRNSDPDGEAQTLDTLGFIEHHSGNLAQARAYYERAIVHFRAIGHTHFQADIQAHLGEIHRAEGDIEAARAAFQESRELYRSNRRGADADRIQRELNDLDDRPRMQLAT